MLRIKYLLIFTFVTKLIFGQTNKIDSLTRVLNKETNPQKKISVLFKLAEYCDTKDNLKYALPAIDLIQGLKKKTNDTNELKSLYEKEGDMYSIFIHAYYFNPIYREDKKIEECLNNALINYKAYDNWDKIESVVSKQQSLYRKTGDVFMELQSLKIALSYAKTRGNTIAMARYNYRIADFYSIIGDSLKTMEYANQGIELEKIINKPERQNRGYYLGAELFSNINKNKEAIDLYNKSLNGYLSTKDSFAISSNYLGIGEAYLNLNEYDKAKEYFNKALLYSDTSNTEERLQYLRILDNFGKIDYKLGNYLKALEYHKFCFSKHEPWKLSGVYYTAQHRLAMDYFKLKKYHEAKKFELSCLEWAKLWAGAKNVLQNELLLYQIDSALANYNGAFEHYKNYIKIKDILSIEDIKKANAREELQSKYEEQVKEEKRIHEKKREQANAEIKQQKLIRNSFIVGFILLLVLALFVLKSYIAKRNHNDELAFKNSQISKQKQLVDEKQKEILDSITYAKRLQSAILPPNDFVQKHLSKFFIYYQPKDIVAGDFYWAEKVEDKFFIAAADSTGHGVPGAMVSVVCSNALNRAIKEFKLTDTGKILDKTRELVLETFEKSASEVKDGMDISLLCIDSKNQSIFWSGANNPLWYIQDAELKEIKADKQPIGKTDSPKPFTTHEIKYKENTTFYLFTDGLADQFGGPNGKKFKYKQFSDLLIKNNNLSQKQQADIINKAFSDWKGDLEQVDDVCVIGIKL